MQQIEAASHLSLKDRVTARPGPKPSKDGGPLIAFTRSDLRLRPRQNAEEPAIDFIELRPGALPDESLFAEPGGHRMLATPFQRPDWLRSWQNMVAGGRAGSPVTAIGFSEGEPVFVLPLMVMKKFGARVLSWHAYPVSDYSAPIFNAGHLALASRIDGASILRQIARRIGGIDLVYVPKLPTKVSGIENPFVLEGAVPYHARAHAVSLPQNESWDLFFQRLRSSKTRRRLREKLAALEKQGGVRFRFAEGTEEARQTVAQCLAGKSRQLAGQGHWDPFSEPGVRDFLIRYFSEGAGTSTWACSFSTGSEVIASAIGFRDEDNWFLYQMSLEDTEKARHSPGTHMLLNIMQHCAGQSVPQFDLGLGDESYKTEWCDIHRDLMISTLPLTPRGKLLEKLLRVRAAVRSRLSSDPKLYERAKQVKLLAKKIRLPF